MLAAKKYDIETYESMSDYIHGNPVTIKEIYIPGYNLTFNYTDKLNVFNETRMENIVHEDILLEESFVLKLVEINRMNNEVNTLKKDIGDDAKKLF